MLQCAGIYDTRRYHPAAPGAEKDVTSKRTASKAGSSEAGSRVMCAECGQQALPWGAGLLCSQCRVRALDSHCVMCTWLHTKQHKEGLCNHLQTEMGTLIRLNAS